MPESDALGSDAPTDSASFQEQAAHYEALVETMRERADEMREGGGPEKIQKQHDRGKLTARERIEYLVDDAEQFRELGLFAGYEMYEEEGGCPAGGTVMGLGPVSGRECMVVAN
ncbi:MAG: methylcrotonoyl-CoA carboxylase, partial [Bacteroidetes bacterium SW_7_64_58]